MPFKSQAQRAYMHIHHPELAARWEKETPSGALPEHVKPKKRSTPSRKSASMPAPGRRRVARRAATSTASSKPRGGHSKQRRKR